VQAEAVIVPVAEQEAGFRLPEIAEVGKNSSSKSLSSMFFLAKA